MKSLLLFLVLCGVVRATPYVFTLTGTATSTFGTVPFSPGDTVTATITIDPTLPDANPGDPTAGSYLHTGTSSLIQFSNGVSFSDLPFEYDVLNNYQLSVPGLETSYDGIAFYFYQSTFTLGFEIRLALNAFNDDFALTPTLGPIIPTGNAELPVPTDWFYMTRGAPGYGNISGPIGSIATSPASVPELPSTIGLLSAAFALLGLAHRTRGAIGRGR